MHLKLGEKPVKVFNNDNRSIELFKNLKSRSNITPCKV